MNKLDEINAKILASLYTEIKPCCVSDTPDAHTVWIKVDGQSFAIDGYQDTKEDAKWMQQMLGKAFLAMLQKYQ